MSVGSMIQRLRAAGLIGRREPPTFDRPEPYLGPWPIRSHRTIAEVDAAAIPEGRS